MVDFMKDVAQEKKTLSVEERNLLSVAYKNVVGARRASWRILSSLEQKAKEKESDTPGVDMVQLTKDYRTKVEEELKNICKDVLQVIDDVLIPNASEKESKVFYYKM